MKERGIAFPGWGVRAILAGLKTQTRRVVKPDWWRCLDPEDPDDRERALTMCPYGQPGNLLWVRETWKFLGVNMLRLGRTHSTEDGVFQYRADNSKRQINRPFQDIEKYMATKQGGQWRSPIHMPRWVSRLVLPITGVRVERVQDISEADAVAEGISEPEPSHGKWCDPTTGRESHWSYRRPFARIWDSIHGPGAWKRNDWVWVPQWEPVTQ